MSSWDEAHDAAPLVRQIEVSRESDWIIVRLDGEPVWKRYTRDPVFDRVRVGFSANRSPQVPKSRLAFTTCFLLGSWRASGQAAWYARNCVDVPIPAEGEPPTVWSRTSGLVGVI